MNGFDTAPGGSAASGTTVGVAFLNLTNPSAVTFPRINADNTVTALSAANFLTAIGAAGLGANSFTGAQTVTLTALGTTTTAGASLINSTAAAAGAQQNGPFFTSQGSGWKTDATAGSQAVKFQWGTVAIQGAAAPTGQWALQQGINGAAPANVMGVSADGRLTLTGSTGSSTAVTSSANEVALVPIGASTLGFINNLYQYAQLQITGAGEMGWFAGSHKFRDNSFGTYLKVSPVAASVDVTVGGATDMDLSLSSAGTGLINFSSAVASADAAAVSTHTVELKVAGTTYKFLIKTP